MHGENLSLFADPMADAIDALHASTAIYTAEPIVDQLLNKLQWPDGAKRIIDPSCGDGMVLVRALERLLATIDVFDDHQFDKIEGWEIHPAARRRLSRQTDLPLSKDATLFSQKRNRNTREYRSPSPTFFYAAIRCFSAYCNTSFDITSSKLTLSLLLNASDLLS